MAGATGRGISRTFPLILPATASPGHLQLGSSHQNFSIYFDSPGRPPGRPRWKTCMLRQISLAWRNIKNNGRTIGLLSLDNWRGVNLWRNKNELSTLGGRGAGGMPARAPSLRIIYFYIPVSPLARHIYAPELIKTNHTKTRALPSIL